MNLTKYERETILNFNEGDSEASVYTHSRPLMRRLGKLAKDRPGECRLSKTTHDGQAAEFYIPKGWIRVTPPRVATPAQRAASLAALKKAKDSQ